MSQDEGASATFWEEKKAELEKDCDNINEIIAILKQTDGKERVISTLVDIQKEYFLSEIDTCAIYIKQFKKGWPC